MDGSSDLCILLFLKRNGIDLAPPILDYSLMKGLRDASNGATPQVDWFLNSRYSTCSHKYKMHWDLWKAWAIAHPEFPGFHFEFNNSQDNRVLIYDAFDALCSLNTQPFVNSRLQHKICNQLNIFLDYFLSEIRAAKLSAQFYKLILLLEKLFIPFLFSLANAISRRRSKNTLQARILGRLYSLYVTIIRNKLFRS